MAALADGDDGVKNKEFAVAGIGFKKSSTKSLPGTSLASAESLSMPLVQEVVLSADIRCAECQKRVADLISKLSDTQSVLVNLMEKKVTVTCRYTAVVKVSTKQIAVRYRNPLGKVAMIKRIFGSSCS